MLSSPSLIVLFGVLCAAEALALRWRGMRAPRVNDAISSSMCGLLDAMVNTSGFAVFAALYAQLLARAPWILPRNLATWILAILAHDLAYYAFHRASHRVALLWAAHEVHHQSDDYTLSVSLRQGTIATWISWAFYAPLALLGVSLEQFVAVHIAHQLYQFAVHTRLLRTLGPLEWLLATPSHHRVHHSREPAQLDRNYGGFLIVWDRLFRSFEREESEPRYGTTEGIQSWSPLWANLAPFARVIARARAQATLREAARALLGPPTSDRDASPLREDYDPALSDSATVYATAQHGAILWTALAWIGEHARMYSVVSALLALWVVCSMQALSWVLDARRGWKRLERARAALTAVAAVVVAALQWVSVVPAALVVLGCLWSLYELRSVPEGALG